MTEEFSIHHSALFPRYVQNYKIHSSPSDLFSLNLLPSTDWQRRISLPPVKYTSFLTKVCENTSKYRQWLSVPLYLCLCSTEQSILWSSKSHWYNIKQTTNISRVKTAVAFPTPRGISCWKHQCGWSGTVCTAHSWGSRKSHNEVMLRSDTAEPNTSQVVLSH